MITGNVGKFNFLQAGIFILLIIIVSGCSGSDPVTPSNNLSGSEPSSLQGFQYETNRYNWGLWEVTIDPVAMTAEMVPMRDGQVHFNVLQMLEGWACTNCVQIVDLSYNENENLEVDISIRHPYPADRLDLTGRDVRGIAIFPATMSFPNHFVRNRYGNEKPLNASGILVNADGWTTHFNRETAFEGTRLFDYVRGRMTFENEKDIIGNLHPFKYFYSHQYKQLFYPGREVVVTYELDIPFQSEFTFAYSVDASWNFPLRFPVNNPVTDFNTSTSAREAYQISMTVDNNTLTQRDGSASCTIDIFDHQGYETISVITVEAPDLWDGVKYIDHTTPSFTSEEMARYNFSFSNETGYAKYEDGGSDMLVVVEDIGMSVVGEDVRGYHIFKIPVEDVAKAWRPRGGWFDHLGFVGPGPTPDRYDITVIPNSQSPWAFVPGETMILVANDSTESYVVYNRDFDEWRYLAGYPGNPNSWILDTQRIDASFNGALGVTTNSDVVVDGEYLAKHCANLHIPGGIYTTSWYTGSLDDTVPYLEIAADVSGGFGMAVGDPIYALFINDAGSGYPAPTATSIQRIGSPYNDPYEVQRGKLPSRTALSGPVGPFGISDSFFVGMAVDDEPFGEASPYVAHIYAAENEDLGGFFNNNEIDIFRINFADTDDVSHVLTFDDSLLGSSYIGPMIGNPAIVDIETLPALTNEVYMGAGQYAEHNWMAVLYDVEPSRWFIEIFDPFLPDGEWQEPIYSTEAFSGNAFAMDVDPVNFEIYVLHDDQPSGIGVPQVTCLELN